MRNTIEIIGLAFMAGIVMLAFAHTGIFDAGLQWQASTDAGQAVIEQTMSEHGLSGSGNAIVELDEKYDFAGSMDKINRALT